MGLGPPRRRKVVGEVKPVPLKLQRQCKGRLESLTGVFEQSGGTRSLMKLGCCLTGVVLRSSLEYLAPSHRPRRNGDWLRFTSCANGESTPRARVKEGRREGNSNSRSKESFRWHVHLFVLMSASTQHTLLSNSSSSNHSQETKL